MEALDSNKFGLTIAVLIVGSILVVFCGYCKFLANKKPRNDDIDQ